jgi:hypothetical protein
MAAPRKYVYLEVRANLFGTLSVYQNQFENSHFEELPNFGTFEKNSRYG